MAEKEAATGAESSTSADAFAEPRARTVHFGFDRNGGSRNRTLFPLEASE